MPVNLFTAEQYDPKYLKLNPKGLVPTLVHDGNAIAESTLICEYLDEAFPAPPLKPDDPAGRARMRMWSKFVDEGLFEGVTEISFSAMFRERMKNMPEEIRQVRFRNIGDPRRRDRFMSTYELGVQSPYVLHAIGAYERAFKIMEQTLAEGGPWLIGDQADARRHQHDAVRGAAVLSRPARRVDVGAAAYHGVVAAGASVAELQERPERSHQRDRVRRNGDARPQDPRPSGGAARRGAARGPAGGNTKRMSVGRSWKRDNYGSKPRSSSVRGGGAGFGDRTRGRGEQEAGPRQRMGRAGSQGAQSPKPF